MSEIIAIPDIPLLIPGKGKTGIESFSIPRMKSEKYSNTTAQ